MAGRKELATVPKGLRLPVARAHAGSLMPYFTTGIQGMSPVEKPGLGTFSVSENGFMMYDPEFLEKLFSDEAATVILHEYMHTYLKHGPRFRELVAKGILDPTEEDHALFNDAADAEINDNLEEAGCVFPREEVLGPPITPKSLGLPAHRSAEEYAIALKKKGYKSPRPQPGQGPAGQWPACGSGAGNPIPDEPPADHPDAKSDVEQIMDRENSSREVQKHQKTRGNVPLGIQQYADAVLAPPKVSWENELQAEAGRAIRTKAGEIDYTYAERSRMQATMHVIFGDEAPVLPGMHQPLAEVALVVDTSGSMSGTYPRILSEAEAILKTLGGAKLTVVAIDTEVHALVQAKSVEEIQKNLKGGGGTDFRPAFDALEKLPKGKPDIVVFATDGYGMYPDVPPSWKHVWLEINGQISVPWGKVIKVEVDEDGQ